MREERKQLKIRKKLDTNSYRKGQTTWPLQLFSHLISACYRVIRCWRDRECYTCRTSIWYHLQNVQISPEAPMRRRNGDMFRLSKLESHCNESARKRLKAHLTSVLQHVSAMSCLSNLPSHWQHCTPRKMGKVKKRQLKQMPVQQSSWPATCYWRLFITTEGHKWKIHKREIYNM